MARSFDPVQLGSIEMFCKAAELQGFTAAAHALGVTAAAVSRSVGRLEERLQVRLFTRTTRLIRLTDDGHSYYAECRQALAQIENAERAIHGRQAEPTGVLRISMPTTYGHYRVLPVLAAFMAQYPKIRVDVDLSNRNIEFVEEGFDLAIRLGTPQDSRLVARKLEDATLGILPHPSICNAEARRTGWRTCRHTSALGLCGPAPVAACPGLFATMAKMSNGISPAASACMTTCWVA